MFHDFLQIETSPGNSSHQGKTGYIWYTLGLVIPCQVASPQSPAPFHQAIWILRNTPVFRNFRQSIPIKKSSNPKEIASGLLEALTAPCGIMRMISFACFSHLNTQEKTDE